MIAQLKNLDQQVRETTEEFPDEVVGMRYSISHDWSGDPAIFFRVLLSDMASREVVLGDVTSRVGASLFDKLALSNFDHTPYFSLGSRSEQEMLSNPEWPSLTTS